MPDHDAIFSEDAPALVGPKWFDNAARWIKGHERTMLSLGIILHIIVLVTMIAMHAGPYLFGETIRLKVVPVDPRDYFRGDYVVLSYDINRVPPEGIEGIPTASNAWWRSRRWNEEAWLADRTVYITLELDADGRHWQGVKASTTRPASGKFITGRYSPSGWTGPLKFGIEAFYVEEGTGLDWEKARNSHELTAEIALSPWGQAKLKSLAID